MIILQLIRRLVKVLRSASSPFQIAGGFTLGMFLGLVSLRTLFALPAVLCLVLLNVNLAAALFGLLCFRLLAYLLDPLLHSLGYGLLTLPALNPMWTALYNMRFVPYTRFNNTVVLGSLAAALVLAFPVYRGAAALVRAYRERFEERIRRWRIIQILKNSRLIRWWNRAGDLRG